jgi:allantoinase
MFETLIKGGMVVTELGTKELDVALQDGKIVALLAPESDAIAKEVIDAEGKHVLPGAIDIHFHVRAPAYPQRGTVASETRAAAAGGVTTLFEMPISKPCCATPEIFRQRKDLFAKDAYVNFGLYGAPGMLKADYIKGMVEEGAIGFKIFMTEAPKGRDDEFVGLCLPGEGELYEALKLVAETNLVTVVHAESNDLLSHFSNQLKATGRNDAQTHGESRPPVVEAVAIAKLLTMNEGLDAKLHIAHVTCRHAVETIKKFQVTMDVTGETCPQYLLFTEQALADYGSYAKINPPLRKEDDQQALWDALADGTLMAVTTDHSPFAVEEKEKAKTDIWAAPPGAPGIEELVIGMLDAVAKDKLSLEQAVKLISTNGAKRFGLYPQKGVIAEGSDADIILVDLKQSTTIDKSNLFSQAKLCDYLYDGMTFQGKVLSTILAGRTIFKNGEVTGQAGWGDFVRPKTQPKEHA